MANYSEEALVQSLKDSIVSAAAIGIVKITLDDALIFVEDLDDVRELCENLQVSVKEASN